MMHVQEGSIVYGLCPQSLPLAMSTSSATSRRVLRNLDHLWQGTNQKFINKLRPSFAQSTPAYVPPKDRITFWNIVPGDVVKLRSGAIGHDEDGRPIRGEGIVTSIDRTTNRLLLRDIDDNHKMAPKNVKHVVPRLIDPEAGEEKGFSGNTTSVPRPVHYSKVMLKVPDTQTYASRIVRSKPFYDRQKGMFVWKRFAIVKATDEESLRTGGALKKIYVPWPKVPERRRPFRTTHADGRVAEAQFRDGSSVPAELVVMAVGIRPNYALAEASGLYCDRGVVVNDHLQTFDPRIYAVGECVSHRGVSYGLVAPLFDMAKVAANRAKALAAVAQIKQRFAAYENNFLCEV